MIYCAGLGPVDRSDAFETSGRGRRGLTDHSYCFGMGRHRHAGWKGVVMPFTGAKLRCSGRVLIPFLVLAVAAFVYSRYGFDRQLVRDSAILTYSAQRLADGVPPYVSTFQSRGPIAPIMAGFGVIFSKHLSWDDLHTVRLLFFAISSFACLSMYLLGEGLFRSSWVGSFAALTFLGSFCFAKFAASGPRMKTPMVLFEVLNLLFTSKRKWFWAGLCGSLSALTWQPAAIFPLVTLTLAAAQPRETRIRAIAAALSGIGLPTLVIVAYFQSHGAVYEFLDGFILYNLLYLDRREPSLISHVLTPARAVTAGYDTTLLPILIGLMMVVYFYFWRRSLHESLADTLTKDPFAPILLSFPAPVVWSVLDFQACADFYVLLPYTSVGFAAFLDGAVRYLGASVPRALGGRAPRFLSIGLCIALTALAWSNVLRYGPDAYTLDDQKQAVIEVENSFGNDARLLSIGVPEILVLLHRTNPTPYVFIEVGIDHRIHAKTPGGFAAWLEELRAYDPDVVAFDEDTFGTYIPDLIRWLRSEYHREKVGRWTLYVRN